MKKIQALCLFGLIATLAVWALPLRFKPYRIHRDLDDYKILLIDQDYEWGFDSSGMVKVRISEGYGLPQGGKRELLAPIRQEWIDKISRSRRRWPVISWQLHYDEWGPSHTTRDDGVEVTQTGTTVCVPYSIFALIFAFPLVWCFIFRRRKNS